MFTAKLLVIMIINFPVKLKVSDSLARPGGSGAPPAGRLSNLTRNPGVLVLVTEYRACQHNSSNLDTARRT